MPEPITMLGVAVTEDELTRPPSPSDLRDEHRDVGVSWPVRGVSGLVGLLLGLTAGSVLLTFALLPAGWWWPLGCAVPLVAALYLALRRADGLDARWVMAVAAVALAALAAAPLPGQGFGSSLFLAIGAVVLTGLLAKVWRMIAAVRRDVLVWNAAYERLAVDPQRAAEVRLSVDVESHGSRRRFTGDVSYVGDDGVERTVPLVSARHAQIHFPAETVISPESPVVVWHSPDHGVVHTMVLRDPV